MGNSRDIWKILAFLLPVPVLFLLLGDTKWALISLCLIPIPFIFWALSVVLIGQKRREIMKHMTEAERDEARRLAKTYGRRVGWLFAVPAAAIYVILSEIIGVRNPVYYLFLFAAFLLIWLPYGLHNLKKMNRFLFSTGYAREKGWDSELS